ncbi:hypothetical protein CL629_03760 [bacterium]|nr:hypothetical protein [bacterium]|tara:strand:- start:4663 stop:4869 length:207 start_codon:yes stop_codon:yes gene_type:complete
MESIFSTITLFAFPIIIVVFIIITIVLEHHWKKYSVGIDILKRIRKIYYRVSAVLFIFVAISFALSFL